MPQNNPDWLATRLIQDITPTDISQRGETLGQYTFGEPGDYWKHKPVQEKFGSDYNQFLDFYQKEKNDFTSASYMERQEQNDPVRRRALQREATSNHLDPGFGSVPLITQVIPDLEGRDYNWSRIGQYGKPTFSWREQAAENGVKRLDGSWVNYDDFESSNPDSPAKFATDENGQVLLNDENKPYLQEMAYGEALRSNEQVYSPHANWWGLYGHEYGAKQFAANLVNFIPNFLTGVADDVYTISNIFTDDGSQTNLDINNRIQHMRYWDWGMTTEGQESMFSTEGITNMVLQGVAQLAGMKGTGLAASGIARGIGATVPAANRIGSFSGKALMSMMVGAESARISRDYGLSKDETALITLATMVATYPLMNLSEFALEGVLGKAYGVPTIKKGFEAFGARLKNSNWTPKMLKTAAGRRATVMEMRYLATQIDTLPLGGFATAAVAEGIEESAEEVVKQSLFMIHDLAKNRGFTVSDIDPGLTSSKGTFFGNEFEGLDWGQQFEQVAAAGVAGSIAGGFAGGLAKKIWKQAPETIDHLTEAAIRGGKPLADIEAYIKAMHEQGRLGQTWVDPMSDALTKSENDMVYEAITGTLNTLKQTVQQYGLEESFEGTDQELKNFFSNELPEILGDKASESPAGMTSFVEDIKNQVNKVEKLRNSGRDDEGFQPELEAAEKRLTEIRSGGATAEYKEQLAGHLAQVAYQRNQIESKMLKSISPQYKRSQFIAQGWDLLPHEFQFLNKRISQDYQNNTKAAEKQQEELEELSKSTTLDSEVIDQISAGRKGELEVEARDKVRKAYAALKPEEDTMLLGELKSQSTKAKNPNLFRKKGLTKFLDLWDSKRPGESIDPSFLTANEKAALEATQQLEKARNATVKPIDFPKNTDGYFKPMSKDPEKGFHVLGDDMRQLIREEKEREAALTVNNESNYIGDPGYLFILSQSLSARIDQITRNEGIKSLLKGKLNQPDILTEEEYTKPILEKLIELKGEVTGLMETSAKNEDNPEALKVSMARQEMLRVQGTLMSNQNAAFASVLYDQEKNYNLRLGDAIKEDDYVAFSEIMLELEDALHVGIKEGDWKSMVDAYVEAGHWGAATYFHGVAGLKSSDFHQAYKEAYDAAEKRPSAAQYSVIKDLVKTAASESGFSQGQTSIPIRFAALLNGGGGTGKSSVTLGYTSLTLSDYYNNQYDKKERGIALAGPSRNGEAKAVNLKTQLDTNFKGKSFTIESDVLALLQNEEEADKYNVLIIDEVSLNNGEEMNAIFTALNTLNTNRLGKNQAPLSLLMAGDSMQLTSISSDGQTELSVFEKLNYRVPTPNRLTFSFRGVNKQLTDIESAFQKIVRDSTAQIRTKFTWDKDGKGVKVLHTGDNTISEEHLNQITSFLAQAKKNNEKHVIISDRTDLPAELLDEGYKIISVRESQGLDWDKVVYLPKSHKIRSTEASETYDARAYYTSLTRATQGVLVLTDLSTGLTSEKGLVTNYKSKNAAPTVDEESARMEALDERAEPLSPRASKETTRDKTDAELLSDIQEMTGRKEETPQQVSAPLTIHEQITRRQSIIEDYNKKLAEVDKEYSDRIADNIGQNFYHNGETGTLSLDGQTLVFETSSRIYELGNVTELNNKTLNELGLEQIKRLDVEVADDNSVLYRGQRYVNGHSDPLAAITRNKDGDVINVRLETTNGQKRTIKGQAAQEIAYQYTLKNFEENATDEQREFLKTETIKELVNPITSPQKIRVIGSSYELSTPSQEETTQESSEENQGEEESVAFFPTRGQTIAAEKAASEPEQTVPVEDPLIEQEKQAAKTEITNTYLPQIEASTPNLKITEQLKDYFANAGRDGRININTDMVSTDDPSGEVSKVVLFKEKHPEKYARTNLFIRVARPGVGKFQQRPGVNNFDPNVKQRIWLYLEAELDGQTSTIGSLPIAENNGIDLETMFKDLDLGENGVAFSINKSILSNVNKVTNPELFPSGMNWKPIKTGVLTLKEFAEAYPRLRFSKPMIAMSDILYPGQDNASIHKGQAFIAVSQYHETVEELNADLSIQGINNLKYIKLLPLDDGLGKSKRDVRNKISSARRDSLLIAALEKAEVLKPDAKVTAATDASKLNDVLWHKLYNTSDGAVQSVGLDERGNRSRFNDAETAKKIPLIKTLHEIVHDPNEHVDVRRNANLRLPAILRDYESLDVEFDGKKIRSFDELSEAGREYADSLSFLGRKNMPIKSLQNPKHIVNNVYKEVNKRMEAASGQEAYIPAHYTAGTQTKGDHPWAMSPQINDKLGGDNYPAEYNNSILAESARIHISNGLRNPHYEINTTGVVDKLAALNTKENKVVTTNETPKVVSTPKVLPEPNALTDEEVPDVPEKALTPFRDLYYKGENASLLGEGINRFRRLITDSLYITEAGEFLGINKLDPTIKQLRKRYKDKAAEQPDLSQENLYLADESTKSEYHDWVIGKQFDFLLQYAYPSVKFNEGEYKTNVNHKRHSGIDSKEESALGENTTAQVKTLIYSTPLMVPNNDGTFQTWKKDGYTTDLGTVYLSMEDTPMMIEDIGNALKTVSEGSSVDRLAVAMEKVGQSNPFVNALYNRYFNPNGYILDGVRHEPFINMQSVEGLKLADALAVFLLSNKNKRHYKVDVNDVQPLPVSSTGKTRLVAFQAILHMRDMANVDNNSLQNYDPTKSSFTLDQQTFNLSEPPTEDKIISLYKLLGLPMSPKVIDGLSSKNKRVNDGRPREEIIKPVLKELNAKGIKYIEQIKGGPKFVQLSDSFLNRIAEAAAMADGNSFANYSRNLEGNKIFTLQKRNSLETSFRNFQGLQESDPLSANLFTQGNWEIVDYATKLGIKQTTDSGFEKISDNTSLLTEETFMLDLFYGFFKPLQTVANNPTVEPITLLPFVEYADAKSNIVPLIKLGRNPFVSSYNNEVIQDYIDSKREYYNKLEQKILGRYQAAGFDVKSLKDVSTLLSEQSVESIQQLNLVENLDYQVIQNKEGNDVLQVKKTLVNDIENSRKLTPTIVKNSSQEFIGKMDTIFQKLPKDLQSEFTDLVKDYGSPQEAMAMYYYTWLATSFNMRVATIGPSQSFSGVNEDREGIDMIKRAKTITGPITSLLLRSDSWSLDIDPKLPAEESPDIAIDPTKVLNIYAGSNENTALSNFAQRPISDPLGVSFNNVEAAFQYAKTNFAGGDENPDNDDIRQKLQTATGAEAKSLGRKIKGLNVAAWDAASEAIMYDLIKTSFEENPTALKTLQDTGNSLLTHTQDKSKWGELFPKILMQVRQDLAQTAKPYFEIDLENLSVNDELLDDVSLHEGYKLTKFAKAAVIKEPTTVVKLLSGEFNETQEIWDGATFVTPLYRIFQKASQGGDSGTLVTPTMKNLTVSHNGDHTKIIKNAEYEITPELLRISDPFLKRVFNKMLSVPFTNEIRVGGKKVNSALEYLMKVEGVKEDYSNLTYGHFQNLAKAMVMTLNQGDFITEAIPQSSIKLGAEAINDVDSDQAFRSININQEGKGSQLNATQDPNAPNPEKVFSSQISSIMVLNAEVGEKSAIQSLRNSQLAINELEGQKLEESNLDQIRERFINQLSEGSSGILNKKDRLKAHKNTEQIALGDRSVFNLFYPTMVSDYGAAAVSPKTKGMQMVLHAADHVVDVSHFRGADEKHLTKLRYSEPTKNGIPISQDPKFQALTTTKERHNWLQKQEGLEEGQTEIIIPRGLLADLGIFNDEEIRTLQPHQITAAKLAERDYEKKLKQKLNLTLEEANKILKSIDAANEVEAETTSITQQLSNRIKFPSIKMDPDKSTEEVSADSFLGQSRAKELDLDKITLSEAEELLKEERRAYDRLLKCIK